MSFKKKLVFYWKQMEEIKFEFHFSIQFGTFGTTNLRCLVVSTGYDVCSLQFMIRKHNYLLFRYEITIQHTGGPLLDKRGVADTLRSSKMVPFFSLCHKNLIIQAEIHAVEMIFRDYPTFVNSLNLHLHHHYFYSLPAGSRR